MKSLLIDRFRTRDSRTLRATLLAAVLVTFLASFLFFGALTAAFIILSVCLGYALTAFFCFQPEGLKWRVEVENLLKSAFPSYLKPSPVARDAVVANVRCHKEARKIIKLVMRDFVASWYDQLTADKTFPEDVQRVLEHIALEVNLRLQLVDVDKMVSELVAIVIPYIEVLNEVGVHGDKEFSTRHDRCVRLFENNPSVAHKALRTPDAESRHYRHIVDVAIQCCLPSEYRSCGVATMFVREVLLHKVLRSLIDLLCDPDFLMAAVPLVLNKAPPEKVEADLRTMEEENSKLDAPVVVEPCVAMATAGGQRSGRAGSKGLGRSKSISVTPSSALLGTTELNGRGGTSKGRPRSREGRGLSSRDCEPNASADCGSKNREDHMSEDGEMRRRWKLPRLKNRGDRAMKGKEPARQLKDREDPALGGQEEAVIQEGDQEPEEEEEIDRASINITEHLRCKDKDGEYIGYIIVFPRTLLKPPIQGYLKLLDSETHCYGLRRYSDFVKLRTSLSKSPSLTAACVKGIDLPDKHSISSILSKLPFTDSDPNILERKEGLQRYLKTIAATDQVTTSDVFQDFLKSAVESKRIQGVNLPQEKFSRKRSQRVTSRGRSKDTERGSELGLYSLLTQFLDNATPLPCHHLNTLSATYSGHPSLSRDPLSHSSLSRDPLSHSSLSRDPLSHPSLSRDPLSHPSLSRDPLSHPSLSRDPLSHPSLSTESVGAITHTEDDEEFVELEYQASPVGSVGSGGCPLNSAEGVLDAWDTPTDHTHSPPNNSPPPCNMELEEDHTSGGMERGELMSGLRKPEVTPRVSESTPVLRLSEVSPVVRVQESTPVLRLSDVSPVVKVSEVSPVVKVSDMTPGELPEVTLGAGTRAPLSASSTVPVADNTIGPPPTATSHINGWWGLVCAMKRIISQVGSGLGRGFVFFFYVLLSGACPVTDTHVRGLTKEFETRMPLSNSLLSLATGAARLQCPRTCALGEVPQLGVLSVVGVPMECFIWKMLHEVVYCENVWARAVFALRNQLWPNGKLLQEKRPLLSEEQKKEQINVAVKSLKKFLPDALPYIVGPEAYDGSLRHCLECLQNKRINKHFILRVIDHLMVNVFPELMEKDFQKQLMRIRSSTGPGRKAASAARL